MKKLAKVATGHPWIILIVIAILTGYFGFNATRVTMTTDIKEFFPEDDPRVVTFNQVEDTFGGAEYIMVAITSDNIFTSPTLKKIDRLSRELADLDGVSSLRSLTSIDMIKGTDWGLEVVPLIPEIPGDEKKLNELKEQVLNDELYGGIIVSEDARAALNIIEVAPGADSVALAGKIDKILEKYQGPERLYLTGTPVLNSVLVESMQADLKKMLPLVLLIIALILFLYFRNVRGVVLPFLTVIISVIWTLGLMGILNKQLSPINAVLPVILISLGNAYGIYLLNRFQEEIMAGKNRKMAVTGTITTVGLAVLMAGGTTVAGFASNLLSNITQLQDFGMFTSFGVAVALIISLTMIPACLTLLKVKKTSINGQKEKGAELEDKNRTFTGFIADLATGRPVLIVFITLIVVIVALSGLPRLRTDSNFFNFFAGDSEPKIAYNLVRDKFSGSESIEVVLRGDIQKPAVLKAMQKFQDGLEETGLVGQPTSLANIVERTNQAMHENRPEYRRIPTDPDLIAQYLLLIEMSDDSYLKNFVTLDYQTARIQALVRETNPEATERLLRTIDNLSDRYFNGLKIETTTTGIVVLIDALGEMIINGQIKGIIFALIAVFLIVFLLLRSFSGSMLSVLLIGLVTIINFGVMGWAGIPLDIVTVLISSIGIGVGIDYSIHIFSRYLEEKGKGVTDKTAFVKAIKTTGTSIISNAGAVISGFIILTFSSFPPFKYFGILVSLIMLAAAVGALCFIPALVLTGNKIKYKWKEVKKMEG